MSAYEIVVTIAVLCLIGIIALICWFLSFVFGKLSLTVISNFFDDLKWLFTLILLMVLAVVIAVSIGIGLYLIAMSIADFIFALF